MSETLKSPPSKGKYLIVGGGLSGLILALTLYEKGIEFTLLDKEPIHHSSRTAAGLLNPVVFKRLNMSWRADEFLPFAYNFYKRWERSLKKEFYSNRSFLKPITDSDKAIYWQKKADGELAGLIDKEILPQHEGLAPHIGLGIVGKAGVLDTESFLNAVKVFFSSKNMLLTSEVNLNQELIRRVYSIISSYKSKSGLKTHNQIVGIQKFSIYLNSSEKCIDFAGNNYDKIIFCEGNRASKNPLWSCLPWKLAKGEVLKVQIKNSKALDLLEKGHIISKDVFVFKSTNGEFVCGSNYDWEYENENPTTKIKKELLRKLEALLPGAEIEVKEHLSGIRPTVADRRPFIGSHPYISNCYIFNGMGSKAAMIAPNMASEFVQNLLNSESKIDNDVDISRFNKRFFKSFELGELGKQS
ncbi:MAG: FAD-dependent oxidoreductase [Candidatus Kapaibacteriales bacterium]